MVFLAYSSHSFYEVGAIIIKLFFQMWKLRLREVKESDLGRSSSGRTRNNRPTKSLQSEAGAEVLGPPSAHPRPQPWVGASGGGSWAAGQPEARRLIPTTDRQLTLHGAHWTVRSITAASVNPIL